MKTFQYLLLISLVFTLSTSNAQKVKSYKAWVTLINNKEVKGVLYSANEDGLVLRDKDLMDTIAIDAGTIEVIKLRSKGKVGRGALIGAASGLLAGAIIYNVQVNSSSSE